MPPAFRSTRSSRSGRSNTRRPKWPRRASIVACLFRSKKEVQLAKLSQTGLPDLSSSTAVAHCLPFHSDFSLNEARREKQKGKRMALHLFLKTTKFAFVSFAVHNKTFLNGKTWRRPPPPLWNVCKNLNKRWWQSTKQLQWSMSSSSAYLNKFLLEHPARHDKISIYLPRKVIGLVVKIDFTISCGVERKVRDLKSFSDDNFRNSRRRTELVLSRKIKVDDSTTIFSFPHLSLFSRKIL